MVGLKTTKMSKSERSYLKDLLNREVEDTSRHYPFELYTIQDKLELYPAKERMECSKCRKVFINARRKRHGAIFLDHLDCEKCRKLLIKENGTKTP